MLLSADFDHLEIKKSRSMNSLQRNELVFDGHRLGTNRFYTAAQHICLVCEERRGIFNGLFHNVSSSDGHVDVIHVF